MKICETRVISVAMNSLTSYLAVLLPELYQKSGYDSNASINVRVVLYNTHDIASVVKLIVHNLLKRVPSVALETVPGQ